MVFYYVNLSKAFHYPTQLLTFYMLLLNILLILKMLTETLLKIQNSADLSLAARKMRKT
jgi:hypothetical protein